MSEPQGPVLQLPDGVDAQKPLDLFSLFFTEEKFDDDCKKHQHLRRDQARLASRPGSALSPYGWE
ncbi:hypothetical protein IFM47457_04174 [Aspergillus lentulus]|nr:hypothetical protein IFM47457_04174 [Aspergillus lentulus]